MFGFRKKAPEAERSPLAPFTPQTPRGALLYAVGDIHGRADLLNQLMGALRADDVKLEPGRKPILMFLGDYVDRGLTSNQVIEELIRLQSDPAFDVFTLRGNHDQFLLDFLENPQMGPTWLNYGGGATLLSYGVSTPRQSDEAAWTAASQQLAEAMPPSHLAFLKATSLSATFGDYVFVHAGIKPKVALEDQEASDLISIRGQFLASREPAAERCIVFGHTPFETPLVEQNKIGIDTGACVTGVLTALAIKDGERRFIQTGGAGTWPLPVPHTDTKDQPRRI